MSAAVAARRSGLSPFVIFGIGLVLAAAWAIYAGLAYSAVPNFVTDALPTILGVSIAVAAMLVIGHWAPEND